MNDDEDIDRICDEEMDFIAAAAMTLALKGKEPSEAGITRQYVELAMARMEAGEPLNETLHCTLMGILNDTLAGYDPRPAMGIAPKSGRRKSANNAWIAAHYWSLRAVDSLEKRAASDVARMWGISPGRVRKIASEDKTFALQLCTVLSCDQLAGLSRLMAPAKDNTTPEGTDDEYRLSSVASPRNWRE
jgi:hypothetical protein